MAPSGPIPANTLKPVRRPQVLGRRFSSAQNRFPSIRGSKGLSDSGARTPRGPRRPQSADRSELRGRCALAANILPGARPAAPSRDPRRRWPRDRCRGPAPAPRTPRHRDRYPRHRARTASCRTTGARAPGRASGSPPRTAASGRTTIVSGIPRGRLPMQEGMRCRPAATKTRSPQGGIASPARAG